MDNSPVTDQEETHETRNKLKSGKKKKHTRSNGSKSPRRNLDHTTIRCSNAAEAEYLAPSLDFFVCESCEENFENRMELGVHQKDCVEWKRELAIYELTKRTQEKDSQSKKPNPTGIDKIRLRK